MGFGLFPVLLIPFLFLLVACQNSPSPPTTNSEAIEKTPEHKLLQRITDDVLVALATRTYSGLEPYLPLGGPPLTGRQAARLLLGAQAELVVLDRWDAEKIRTSMTADRLSATTKVNVTYRRSPNRPPRRREFTFRFSRSSGQESWRLRLNN